MSVLAYIRVSSKTQDVALQRHAIEKAAAARGDFITEWFAETASAATLNRPELQRLRAAIRTGHHARVYVFRLDRLARSGIRDLLEVVEEMRAYGTELVSVTDGFQINGPASDVIMAVLAFAARMELMAKNERVAAARLRLESEGRKWGRPSRFTRQDRQKILTLQSQGRSIREIAVAVKAPRSSVAYVLSRKGPSHRLPGDHAGAT